MIKPGIYYGMSNADYHGDTDSLSSSGAKLLAREGGAALFHYQQTHPVQPTPAMEFGTAAHSWILEGKEPIVFEPGIKFEGLDGKEYTLTKGRDTKAGRAFTELQAQEHPGVPIVSQSDYEHLAGMREAVLNHSEAARLLALPGKSEVSIFWETETGATLKCRPDYLPDEADPKLGFLPIIDLKTTVDATLEGFRRSAIKFGYHQSAAWYMEGLAKAGIDTDAQMVFIAVEKTPPYLVGVYYFEDLALATGDVSNMQAISTFRDCRAWNRWPGLTELPRSLSIKPYEIPESCRETLEVLGYDW